MSDSAERWGSLSRRSFLRYSAVTAGLATLTRLRVTSAAEAPAPASGALRIFTPHEAEILTAIAARMVDSGDAAMPAVQDTDAIATIDRTLLAVDDAVVWQLRWLLAFFQYAPPVLELRLATFTGMDPAQQDEYLRGWASSRFETRRLAFRALKNLSMLGYYAQDATWRGIHYDGPWVPRSAARQGVGLKG